MITAAHPVIYSTDAEADRAFFRDVLKYPNVDAGGGWLIFKLPPAEVAMHPAKANGPHELYLMCDDLKVTMLELKKLKVTCEKPMELPWGVLTYLTLPGGGKLGLYEPRHPQAHGLKAPSASRTKSAPRRSATKRAR